MSCLIVKCLVLCDIPLPVYCIPSAHTLPRFPPVLDKASAAASGFMEVCAWEHFVL